MRFYGVWFDRTPLYVVQTNRKQNHVSSFDKPANEGQSKKKNSFKESFTASPKRF
jgi:hypothetical protein